jgi:hypothetical protein
MALRIESETPLRLIVRDSCRSNVRLAAIGPPSPGAFKYLPAARLRHKMAGRACLLCPSTSDFDLLGYGESIVNLNTEVAHRALDLGVSQ